MIGQFVQAGSKKDVVDILVGKAIGLNYLRSVSLVMQESLIVHVYGSYLIRRRPGFKDRAPGVWSLESGLTHHAEPWTDRPGEREKP